MWELAVDSGGPSELLSAAIWTFWGVVVTTVGLIIQQYMKSRGDRTGSSPPPASVDGSMVMELAKDVGQLDQRANDADEALDYQDKRIDRIEVWIERTDPDWRSS